MTGKSGGDGAEKVREVNARTEWGTAEMKKSVVFLLMLVAVIAMFAVACGGGRWHLGRWFGGRGSYRR